MDAQQCELCEWCLIDGNGDTLATQAPVAMEADMTVDPNAITLENHDPQATVAPAELEAQRKQATAEKTFHLAGDLSHFEVLEVLGQGGMGMVYHAKDRTLQRDVALKMLRPLGGSNQLSTEALLDEARMASQLNHPNIVTIYDVARADNSNYIVMEWVDGKSLDELIREEGLPLVTAIDYARQIAHGLSSAHQKYIIHRDIKPQNIMLSEQNTLKILDFGIAGLVKHIAEHDETATENNNQTTPAAGTPSYMSPEQAQGLNLDPRSDIFSLGIVLYQMLTGERPFFGKSSTEVKQAICAGKFKPIEQLKPDLPPEVVHTVNKMLTTAKDQRWQSSAELAAALDDIYSDLTYSKNWWQKRHWVTKAAMLLPFIVALGWTAKDILFPASTQQLIEQQLAEATKVAILPFDNISGDPTLQLFGDGLAVNLSTDLATVASEIGDTWIVPATEISRMKEVTPKAVADKYGVELILTGSMQHMGSTRLVVLNLLDAQSGQQLKTTELNIDADDLFGGHALIREKTMELLDWPMSEALATSFNAERPQLDGAFKHYVDGRGYLYRFDQPGNADNALFAFEKAISIDSNYQNAYVGLAETQLRKFIKTSELSWLEKSETTVNTLFKLDSDNKNISFLKAEIAYQRGNYKEAVKLYEQNLKVNINHVASKVGLAKALKQNGNKEKAEKVFMKTIQDHPNNWRVVSGFGIYYFQVGNYQGALEQFKALSLMSPNNDLGVRNMAAAYYALGNIEQAIKYTTQAIKLNPSDRAYSNLGTMLFSEKKYIESVDAFEMAVKLNGSSYLTWGNLGDAYFLTNNQKFKICYENAARIAHKKLLNNANDGLSIAALSYYYAKLENHSKALNLISKINENNSGLEHFVVATAYDAMNLGQEAVNQLEKALIKKYPIEEIIGSPLLENSRKEAKYHNLISEYDNRLN